MCKEHSLTVCNKARFETTHTHDLRRVVELNLTIDYYTSNFVNAVLDNIEVGKTFAP